MEQILYPWRMPQPFESNLEILDKLYPLKVANSLTRTKVRFIPKDSSRVLWYQCGPTVYAESHMGHAKTYVHLDIVKRIMHDLLGYNLVVVQNVTDIDDKIIIRSSEKKIPFLELAKLYESEFMDDMVKLGVELPDIVTRVSEYIPEIISYIEVLISKGIAYESNGSVYFDTKYFECCGHTYGKLFPEQANNLDLIAEGEGSLSFSDDKRNLTDFALWKKAKSHNDDGIVEPQWSSPWGAGRPGWHIECSVMSHEATEMFGGGILDVHAGGIDLKFPHHENEIAQSEGYLGCTQWTNYWLHTGHLNIKGFKMSKSLKNFITIRQALELHTARQIRFLFLLHKYNAPMDYGDNTMTEALNVEKIFVEFFLNVKAVLRRTTLSSPQHVSTKDKALLLYFEEIKSLIMKALLDDFDTPESIQLLQVLIHECNKYMEDSFISSIILSSIAKYITAMLKTFGIIQDSIDIGFPLDTTGTCKEELLTPYLNVITNFREEVRLAAVNGNFDTILAAADKLRDEILPDLGVRLEEKGSGTDTISIWKLADPVTIRLEREQKILANVAKEQLKSVKLQKLREKEEKHKIPPERMFQLGDYEGKFSTFSEVGFPLLDAQGEPLSKNLVKKLEKEKEKQRIVYNKYCSDVIEKPF